MNISLFTGAYLLGKGLSHRTSTLHSMSDSSICPTVNEHCFHLYIPCFGPCSSLKVLSFFLNSFPLVCFSVAFYLFFFFFLSLFLSVLFLTQFSARQDTQNAPANTPPQSNQWVSRWTDGRMDQAFS